MTDQCKILCQTPTQPRQCGFDALPGHDVCAMHFKRLRDSHTEYEFVDDTDD